MKNNEQPSKVSIAVKLFYATLGVGIIRGIIEFSRQAETSSVNFVLIIASFTFCITLFLIYMISRGENWARVTFLVLFIAGVPLSISPLIKSLSYTPISGVLGLLQAAMQLMGIILLFQKESSVWFKGDEEPEKQQNNSGSL